MKTAANILVIGLWVAGASCGDPAPRQAPAQELSPPAKPARTGAETARLIDPDTIPRIPPEQAYELARSGQALLVCAYESELAFKAAKLGGAMSLPAFTALLPSLTREQEIIFYCA